jgi:hypothetical protein
MYVRLQILMKMSITKCSLAKINRRFRSAYCLRHQGDEFPDDGGSTHL